MMWFLGMVVGPGLGGVLADAFNVAVPFFFCGGLALVSMILVLLTVQETAGSIIYVAGPKEKSNPHNTLSANHSNVIVHLALYPVVFAGLYIARFMIAFSNSLIQPVLSVYANKTLDISKTDVGILFTVMGIVTLFTTLPMGTAADKIGRKPMLIFGKFLDAISAFLIILSGSFWPLLFIMMIRELGRGTVNPSITAMFSDVVPISKRGRGMGIFNTFQNVGLVVGSTIGGFLYEFSSTEMPFIACAIAGFVGVIIVLLMVSEPKRTDK